MTCSRFVYAFCSAKCLPFKSVIKRGNAALVNIQDANLFLPHQCLLVDHETQSGRWWSACQCQRPDKDVSLPLYKSLHPRCCGVNLGLLPLGEPPSKKQFVNGSSAFKPYQVWCGRDWQLHQLILLESAESAVDIWGRWEARTSCFHAIARLLGGNSSLTRQAELTALHCFAGSVMHRQWWEYSSPHSSVIDPLRLLLMLKVTPSHPASHWQHQLPAFIIYCFLSVCTWNECMFKAAPFRSCCLSDSTNTRGHFCVGSVVRVFYDWLTLSVQLSRSPLWFSCKPWPVWDFTKNKRGRNI